jgi:hypothetical protein
MGGNDIYWENLARAETHKIRIAMIEAMHVDHHG